MSSTLEKRRCDDLGAFVCGWGAAFVNIIVTFPMTKLMFRQMLHGVPTKGALDQLRHEGLSTLYRGCLPPLFQKTISVSIMFGTFHSFSNSIRENFPGASKVSVTFFAGMMAGSTEALLAPLERVQALLQDRQHHHRFKNTAAVVTFLRPYGLREYYRGLVPILLRNGPSTFLFFTLRDQVKGVLPLNHSELWQAIVSDFVSGAVVGALVSTMAYPLNVVKTIMQVQYGPPRPSFWSVLKKTRAERKTLRKMLYGVHINYTRALMSWGIINACYELFTAEYGKHFGAERDLK
ncbi:mitochondrial nicotinamide adenine dinucleotide transporter SLC25A51-like isoform X2 [Ornithodoros turicata]|uniref:mitochondrial nicotinamide adenine dinucleotide transporter SLC25A51-like isoform X2 n=1 Tax=Ornithodoros turicata TaxID=34597 RepID=UPI0031392259